MCIQAQVGHADIKTTFDTYGALMQQAKKEATVKLEGRCSVLAQGQLVQRLVPEGAILEGNEKVN